MNINKPKSNRGGARKGAGRPKKSDEQALIAKIKPFEKEAWKLLYEGARNGNFKCIQLYLHYLHGRPTNNVDMTTGGEKFHTPIISFFETVNDEEDEIIDNK